jgi:hypothetical protein
VFRMIVSTVSPNRTSRLVFVVVVLLQFKDYASGLFRLLLIPSSAWPTGISSLVMVT